jgi:signal transduction histidine kinase/CheY-like chemotaxis protein
LTGKSVIEFVHPDYRALVAERMIKVVSERTVLPLLEEKFLRLDGSEVEVEVKAMSIRFGNKLAVQLIIRDITERKQAEQKLIKAKELAEESDRLKSAFLANMSHEIRTPMNNILGFTDLLKMDDLTSKQQKEYIQIIKKGGDRLLNIINDIIDISKIESGQMKVSVTKTNINEQIEYISSFFRPEAEEKGIRLIFKNTLLSQDAIINTDREKIFAILINLVKNAIKFTSEGFIEFGYRKKEMLLEFFVKDTGTGIRQEHKELIFERFRQGSESLARNYEGAGLGLSISKAYVEMLGGKIRVDSEPGKGSVFYFTIPYNPDKMPETVIENKVNSDFKEHQIKRLKILIAEDDEASGLLITNIVKAYCKTELKVKTGIEAVEACQANPDIDLILMDIKMPEMDGYEATRQIRQFNKDVIIIAQTAFALTGDKERALQAGCNDYISKPIDGNLLMEIIQKHFKK